MKKYSHNETKKTHAEYMREWRRAKKWMQGFHGVYAGEVWRRGAQTIKVVKPHTEKKDK